MGATWVNTTFKVVDGESAGLVRRCAAMLAEAGAGMAIEFSPLGPVASLQDGLDIVDLSGSDRAGVVVDIWNVSYGPTTWEELERLPADRIAYVQFNDALPRVGDLDIEAMNRRTYPGQGAFDGRPVRVGRPRQRMGRCCERPDPERRAPPCPSGRIRPSCLRDVVGLLALTGRPRRGPSLPDPQCRHQVDAGGAREGTTTTPRALMSLSDSNGWLGTDLMIKGLEGARPIARERL